VRRKTFVAPVLFSTVVRCWRWSYTETHKCAIIDLTRLVLFRILLAYYGALKVTFATVTVSEMAELCE
jgi:hypothetical protein